MGNIGMGYGTLDNTANTGTPENFWNTLDNTRVLTMEQWTILENLTTLDTGILCNIGTTWCQKSPLVKYNDDVSEVVSGERGGFSNGKSKKNESGICAKLTKDGSSSRGIILAKAKFCHYVRMTINNYYFTGFQSNNYLFNNKKFVPTLMNFGVSGIKYALVGESFEDVFLESEGSEKECLSKNCSGLQICFFPQWQS
ncbi:hypothetical protein Glove_194g112 [Diversispora epigaea]|uniref:Uncharacterized protein n=1 Tax=Diversispora epigaea TaxID=1348612 RepID=A0A397IL17_9GLOM|nr:hypothetical protein Glove_194g112 [Diversispora epigaea]